MFATRTLIVSSILSCLSVVSVIAEPTTRFPTSFNDQEAILVNYASNTVLDINMEDLGTPPDQYVHMWTMAPRWTHQLWHLILLDAANGIWALQNNYTGFYLEFPNVSSTPNIQAQAYQYNSTSDPDFASAQWQIYISDDDGMRKYVSLKSKGGLWLNCEAGWAHEWNRAVGVPWDDSDASKWSIIFRNKEWEDVMPPQRR